MQCESEDDCAALIRLLPLTEAALLDWAVNLMADVVQQEHFNKMNSHNIAMVFAPNMTQVLDLDRSGFVFSKKMLPRFIVTCRFADGGSVDGVDVCCPSDEFS